MRGWPRKLGWAACWLAAGHTAEAQVNAPQLARALINAPAGAVRAFALPAAGANADARIPVLVESRTGSSKQAAGAVNGPRLKGGFSTAALTPAELTRLAAARPDLRFSWAPPRRLMLSNADIFTAATKFHEATGQTGTGAAVGILDTGIDPAHPNFLKPDGTTRIAWMIDFSSPPAGLQPALERQFGCDQDFGYRCAIYDAANIDSLIGTARQPNDPIGHGTHVTSLAAGNGDAPPKGHYVGVAPTATLIIAKVVRADRDEIFDTDILLAADFVFNRAKALALPVALNLSLGSDFGPHDGSSPLARALASYVGPEHPGQGIVVAAGNSGGLTFLGTNEYPEPFGVHTEVHVPVDSPTRVPVITLPTGTEKTSGTIFLWLAAREGDDLEIGFEFGDGSSISPLAKGDSGSFEEGSVIVTIVNGDLLDPDRSPVPTKSPGAVIVVDGTWDAGTVFGLNLGGNGTAQLWIDSITDAGPVALLPRGSKRSTVGEPATHPELIAVGATLDRLGWVDYQHRHIQFDSFGGVTDPPLETIAYFSGGGPNAVGVFKPDLVAPGALVIGAMAASADPRDGGGAVSIFRGGVPCPDPAPCQVVNDFYAVTLGTSMSAPQVAGALALMFERDPTLTQAQALAFLQAGARLPGGLIPVEQQLGPGTLDLMGALAAQTGNARAVAPSPATSWLVLGDSFARPDPNWPLQVVVELRDADGELVDGFDADELTLETKLLDVTQPLTRVAPGLWVFQVVAPAGTGTQVGSVALAFAGAPLLEREVPIATDRWVADAGFTTRGGCAVPPEVGSALSPPPAAAWLAILALAAAAVRRRRV